MENALVDSQALLQLQDLVQRGMQGDREVLPALRTFLDTEPALWKEVGTFVAEVERTWMQLLTGEDLVAREILLRQLQALKEEVGGPTSTPLERLLVDRIALCWLQMQQADLLAARLPQAALRDREDPGDAVRLLQSCPRSHLPPLPVNPHFVSGSKGYGDE